jgi:5-hydroxyisourate hydrolase
MAVVTSHTLNGSDGTHAGVIPVTLTNLATGGRIFSTAMDGGGRLSQSVAPAQIDPEATYELVFDLAGYWAARNIKARVHQVALRFSMPDPDGTYHMPVIINPNSYSMWSSS